MRKKNTFQKILIFGWPILILLGLFGVHLLTDETESAGAKIYNLHCANCHMEKGEGLGNLIPSLATSEYLNQQGAAMACLIRNGSENPLENGLKKIMPGNEKLRPVEITTLINYLNTNWGNQGKPVSLKEVETALNQCSRSGK